MVNNPYVNRLACCFVASAVCAIASSNLNSVAFAADVVHCSSYYAWWADICWSPYYFFRMIVRFALTFSSLKWFSFKFYILYVFSMGTWKLKIIFYPLLVLSDNITARLLAPGLCYNLLCFVLNALSYRAMLKMLIDLVIIQI